MDILDLIYDHHVQKIRAKAHEGFKSTCAPEGVVVTEQKQIIQIMTLLAGENKSPITVKTETQMFEYHSYLKLHKKDSFDDSSLFLIADALDPPIGNVRVRISSSVVIRVFSEKYCFEMSVNMLGTMKGKFKLSLPAGITIQKERRSSVRVRVNPKWEVELQGTRMAGVQLPVIVDNLSLGGLCFYCSKHIPHVLQGLQVDLKILWPSHELELDASVYVVDISTFKDTDTSRYHTRFRFENYDKTVRTLETMVADMQREMLESRKKLYVDW